MKPLDAASLLNELGVSSARELVIVSGAGASDEHPSHAPLGWDLLMQAFEGYFLPGVQDEIAGAYEAFQQVIDTSQELFKGRPRLEAVLDVIATSYGDVALGHLTVNFVGREPNRVHRLLAAHLRAGGRQVTANFDRMIEQAVGDPTIPGPHHFHGAVQQPDDTLPFGARLGRIEHGFVEDDREAMLAALVDPETKAIAWFGYSFSDYFDVTPAVVEAIEAGRLDGKSMVAMGFGTSDPSVAEVASDESRAILAAAVARGLRVVTIGGRTGDALFLLLKQLGCHIDSQWSRAEWCDKTDIPVVPPFVADSPAQLRATVDLLRRFGLLGRLAISASALGLSVDDLDGDAAWEYWWKKGKYSTGLKAAARALDRNDDHYRIRRLLLGARCDWIQGRLTRAAVRTIVAIRRLDRQADLPVELYVQALERFGRVAVHMVRTPDARRLALPFLMRALPDYVERMSVIKNSEAASGITLAHASDALQNFRREVLGVYGGAAFDPGVAAEERRQLLKRFTESESLDSYVDYIRGNANKGVWDFRLDPGTDWQKPMTQLYEAVGNDADVHRMTLLSARADVGFGDAFLAAWSLDVSWWQRIRMLVVFATNRPTTRNISP